MFTETRQNIKTSDITYIAAFTALIVICTWISIPTVVPFTMQTFAIFITAGLLGTKKGTLSVLLYIGLGVTGVPVFSGFSGGPAVLFGITGGYIIGFIFTTLITGVLIKYFHRSTLGMIIAMSIGLLVCYLFGTAWFMYIYSKKAGTVGLLTALTNCVIPFIIPDAIKIGMAVLLTRRLSKYVYR